MREERPLEGEALEGRRSRGANTKKGQGLAAAEGIETDDLDAGGDGDTLKARAAVESAFGDLDDAVGQDNALQEAAAGKGFVLHPPNGVGLVLVTHLRRELQRTRHDEVAGGDDDALLTAGGYTITYAIDV